MSNAGAPAFFKTKEELDVMIEAYYDHIKGEYKTVTKIVNGKETEDQICIRPRETPSITGLALFLGFESRQSIYDYEKNGEFSYSIKRAKLRVEVSYEQFLLTQASTGAIFALKNFGWKDKTEVDMRANVAVGDEEIKFE